MHPHIFSFLQNHPYLGYLVVFLAMIFEGDIFLFTAAFLTHQGLFDPFSMFISALTGSLGGDLFWYWLGERLNGSSKFTKWAARIAAPFDDHLKERTLHTIFLSKFIYGTHRAILVRAGMLKIELKRFMKIDVISTLTWIFIVGGLGFASSLSFGSVRHSIRMFEIILLSAVVAFLLISYLVSYEAKKKL